VKLHSFHKALCTKYQAEAGGDNTQAAERKKPLPQTNFASFTKKIRFLRGLTEPSCEQMLGFRKEWFRICKGAWTARIKLGRSHMIFLWQPGVPQGRQTTVPACSFWHASRFI